MRRFLQTKYPARRKTIEQTNSPTFSDLRCVPYQWWLIISMNRFLGQKKPKIR
ncbi:hypothetical protein LINPERPRIM_LOCUS45303 [Linum perenne]